MYTSNISTASPPSEVIQGFTEVIMIVEVIQSDRDGCLTTKADHCYLIFIRSKVKFGGKVIDKVYDQVKLLTSDGTRGVDDEGEIFV